MQVIKNSCARKQKFEVENELKIELEIEMVNKMCWLQCIIYMRHSILWDCGAEAKQYTE